MENEGLLLPEAMRDRLFESMVSVRGDAQRNGATPHLGLGLYIVRLVAHSRWQRARGRSRGRKGVVVTVTLPTTALP